jgi:hypothetical protein
MVGPVNEAASPHSYLGALPPNPRNFPLCRQNGLFLGAGCSRPQPIPAAESALGLRSRSALSSAQVLPEWTTSTSPCNNFLSNGDNPLNSLSHSKGSLQSEQLPHDKRGYVGGTVNTRADLSVNQNAIALWRVFGLFSRPRPRLRQSMAGFEPGF